MSILTYIHGKFDSLRAAIQQGDLVVGNATPTLVRLAIGAANTVLKSNGTDASWAIPQNFIFTSMVPGGRLTLTSAIPVLTATVNDATSIFYALYTHDKVPIYDGTNWKMTTFTELTNTTTDSTVNPAAVAASSNYDLFVWLDGSTLRLGRGPAWTSDTGRGTGAGTTELGRVNGIWMNKIAITNGPAADRGTYVGTVRSASDSKIDWQLGSLAASGGAGILGVWNMYNRVRVATQVRDSTDSWTYAAVTDAWRALNNSATNRVSYISGLAEDAFESKIMVLASNSGTGNGWVGTGYDSTTALSGNSVANILGAGVQGATGGSFTTQSLGFHFQSAIEYENGVDTETFYGDLGVPAFVQNGFDFMGMF